MVAAVFSLRFVVVRGRFEAPFDGVGVGDFAAVGGGCGEGVVALFEEGDEEGRGPACA